ncbi:MAG: gliding motility-associated C-terminal domain-containing protein [Flavobacteriales bacterium]|nr:gliding motility-associated C-terminal domain-containing protein [Flavobacteriales bacterium]
MIIQINKYCLTILLWCICSVVFSQYAYDLFNITDENSSNELYPYVKVDQNDDIIVYGSFAGTIDVDPGAGVLSMTPQIVPGLGTFLGKYDNSGNLVWGFDIPVNRAASAAGDKGLFGYFDIDDQNNVYISGTFENQNVDFDPSAGNHILSATNHDYFIAKYSSSGGLVWAFNLQGAFNPGTFGTNHMHNHYYVMGMDVNSQGEMLVTGRFSGQNVNFNPMGATYNLSSQVGGYSQFICKYDQNGLLLFGFTVDNDISYIGVNAILNCTFDANDDIIITGGINTTVDFDPSSGVRSLSSINNSAYVAKYKGIDGTLIWANLIEGEHNQIKKPLSDQNGNIYVVGNFDAPNGIDFDPQNGSTNSIATNPIGPQAIYFAKYSPQGKFLWYKVLNSYNNALHLFDAELKNNALVIGGMDIIGDADFDPNPNASYILSSGFATGAFAASYDLNGTLQWAQKNLNHAGALADEAKGITIDANGNVYLSGIYYNESQFTSSCNVLSTSNGGTFNSGAFLAKFNPSPNSNPAWINPDTICLNATVDLNDYVIGNLGGSWSGIGVASNGIFSASGLGGTTVTITYEVNGCTKHHDIFIGNKTVNPNLALTDPGVCSEDPVTISTYQNYSQFAWSNGATTSSISTLNPGTYAVTVTDFNGCSGSESVNLAAFPDNDFDLEDTLICPGTTITLDPGGIYDLYCWSDSSTNQTNSVGTGTYHVTVLDANGCFERDTVTIGIKALSVDLGNDTTFCSGSMTLDAGNPGSTYQWSNGSTAQSLVVATSGTYHVTVSSGTCTDRDTIQVTVGGSLNVNLGNDTTFCSGSLTLDAGNPGSTYQWSDGSTAQTLVVTSSGNYHVTVGSGACTDKDTINVLMSAPIINIGPDKLICSGASATFSVNNSALTLLWSNGSTTNSITVNQPGTYSVTATDANGCTASDTAVVTATTGNISLNLGPDIYDCNGSNPWGIWLDASNPGNYFQWNTGSNSQVIQATNSGTYIVTVSSQSGCQETDTVNVYLSDFAVDLGNDTLLCTPGSITLDASHTGSTFSWSTGGYSQTETVNTSGIYAVTVSNNGCFGIDSVQIEMGLLVDISDSVTCNQDSILIDPQDNFDSYSWSTGQTDTSIWVQNNGVYFIDVTKQHCTATDTFTIELRHLTENLGSDTSTCDTSLILASNNSNAGINYLWSNSETANSISVSASGLYVLTVTDGTCVASDSIDVQILGITIDLGSDVTDCINDSVLLSSSGNWDSTLWSTGDTNNNIYVLNSGSYIVEVFQNGCSAMDSINVSIGSLEVDLGPDYATCLGQSITLDAQNSGSTYLWNDGSTNQTFTALNSGVYSVSVTNGVCSDADTITLTIDSVHVDIANIQTCLSDTNLTLNASYNYVWSDGSTGNNLYVNSNGTYSVTMTSSSSACTSVDTFQVTLNQFEVDLGPDTAICDGSALNLNVGISQGIFLWSNNSTNNQITANTTGTYWVSATDANGCSDQDTIQVTIDSLYFDLGVDTSLCNVDSFLIGATVQNASYQWNTGETTSNIYINSTGSYNLTVSNANCTFSDTIDITLNFAQANLPNDTVVCSDSTLTITVLGQGADFLWSTGSTTSNITVNQSAAYQITVSDGFCTDTDSMQVTFDDLSLDLGPDTFACNVDSVLLSAYHPSAQNYLWDGVIANSKIYVQTSGTHYVEISNNNCLLRDTIGVTYESAEVKLGSDTSICDDSFTLNAGLNNNYLWSTGETTQSISVVQGGTYSVFVGSPQCNALDSISIGFRALDFNLGSDTTICEGATVVLRISDTTASNILWNNGSTTSAIAVQNEGTYFVKVGNGDCWAWDTVNVEVIELNADLGQDMLLCQGDTLTLQPQNSSAQFSHLWSDLSTDTALVINEPGTYFVLINTGQCSDADTIEITYDNMNIGLEEEIQICSGQSYTVNSGLSSDLTHLWNGEVGTNFFLLEQPGFNYLAVISPAGCLYEDSVLVVEEYCGLFMPNAFSPNDDGLNDIFKPEATRIEQFEMLVFNRWGDIIFQTEDLELGWDGNKNGNPAKQDIYMYKVTYTIEGNSKIRSTKGTITLVR